MISWHYFSLLKHSAHRAFAEGVSCQSIEATEHKANATAHAYYRAEATEATSATTEVPQALSAESLHHAASS
jgi:hypothetical protein